MATESPEPPEGFTAADAPTSGDSNDFDTVEVPRPSVGEALQGELLAKKPNRGSNDSMLIEVRLTAPYQDLDKGELVHCWMTGGLEKQLTDAGDTDPIPRMAEVYLWVPDTWTDDDGEEHPSYEIGTLE